MLVFAAITSTSTSIADIVLPSYIIKSFCQ
jgi:hypothetical protein